MSKYYSFSDYLKNMHNKKIWRISLSTGFPCPARINDKTGCSFCDGVSFYPPYLNENDNLETQLKKGIEYYSSKKRRLEGIYGYFQYNSSTYGPVDKLLEKYEKVLKLELSKGLVISTRPDYINSEIIENLYRINKKYNKDIWIELGLQSVYDSTLSRINRGHSYKDFCNAVKLIKKISNFKIAVHMIIGLPGETPVITKNGIIKLFKENKIDGIKFRLLEILPGTRIYEEYEKMSKDFFEYDYNSYVNIICDLLEVIPGHVVIMRMVNHKSLKTLGKKNGKDLTKFIFLNDLEETFLKRNSFQGINAEDSQVNNRT